MIIDAILSVTGLGKAFFGWLDRKTDADLGKFTAGVTGDTAINVENIRSRIELTKLAAASRNADRESWWTAWMVPTAFGLFIFHIGWVVFDSIPLFGHVVGSWRVAALPGEIGTMQTAVILTVCGVGGAAAIKRIFGK